MYLSVTQIDEHLYDTTKEFFITHGRSDLLYRNSDSLIGAYLVTQYMLNNGKNGFSFKEGIYNHENRYFSTSHSGNSIAIAIDNKKIAIDLEIIKPRNDILLNSIHTLNEDLGQRENFYLQRCAKECLIKYLNLNAEDVDNITINNISTNQNIKIQGFTFNIKTKVFYKNNTFNIYEKLDNKHVLAILA